MLPSSVVLVGAGNVAYHLGHRLQEKGLDIQQVFSRQEAKAAALAKSLSCVATNDLNQILSLDHCLYIFAVHDDAIGLVANQLTRLAQCNSLFVHTSGAASSQILTEYFDQSGVFYPLQTFSRNRTVDFDTIPICVYSDSQQVLTKLVQIGHRISDQVEVIDDHQRSVLHVAAVFVNNFSNHLFTIGQDIVQAEAIPFDLLRPLILETAAKVQAQSPKAMQTGPAIRGDEQSQLKHLQYLQKHPDYQRFYRLFSHSISQAYQEKKNT